MYLVSPKLLQNLAATNKAPSKIKRRRISTQSDYDKWIKMSEIFGKRVSHTRLS
jgi:hypothetical protein